MRVGTLESKRADATCRRTSTQCTHHAGVLPWHKRELNLRGLHHIVALSSDRGERGGRYVDVMLALIEKGGEFVSNDIWHRVVQVITDQPALQPYCCRKVVALLERPDMATYDESFLKVGPHAYHMQRHASSLHPRSGCVCFRWGRRGSVGVRTRATGCAEAQPSPAQPCLDTNKSCGNAAPLSPPPPLTAAGERGSIG